MGEYDGLRDHLRRRSAALWSPTFEEVAQLVLGALSDGAYRYSAGWSNSHDHFQAHAWLAACWMTEDVDLPARTVRFVRS